MNKVDKHCRHYFCHVSISPHAFSIYLWHLLNAKFLEIYYRLLHSKRQTTNHNRKATVKYRQQKREKHVNTR
jgi:hypothetical protein